ncbi:MAG: hypothetical protein E2O52_02300 [Gammaproteobacteria bacterium]|nr:MAG: hypothetical protein E2O52_02300 [Gammaproteobacteria bacterium]
MPFVAGSEAGPWSTITAARAYSCEHILWCDYFEQRIKAAEDLDELVAQYEESLHQVATYESERPDMAVLTRYQQQSIEPYKSKIRLETAINVWEKKAQEYQRVWYSWTAGLLMIAWYMSDRMQGRVQSDES